MSRITSSLRRIPIAPRRGVHTSPTGSKPPKRSILLPAGIALGLGGAAWYFAHPRLNHCPTRPDTTSCNTTNFAGAPANLSTSQGSLVTASGAWGPNDRKRYWTETARLIDQPEAEEMLVKNEKHGKLEGSVVKQWDDNFVPSNTPCEDRHRVDIIPAAQLDWLRYTAGDREDGAFWWAWHKLRNAVAIEGKEAPTKFPHIKYTEDEVAIEGDGGSKLMFFSVFDGMGGNTYSDLISKTLHPCLALTLARLRGGGCPGMLDRITPEDVGDEFASVDTDTIAPVYETNFISAALSSTFTALDNAFLDAPLQALRGLITTPSLSPFLPDISPISFLYGKPEGAGCTACTVVVDEEEDRMWVAHVGDSRAVAGWYNEEEGTWRCDVLTEDHSGDNPAEAARRLAKHPEEEAAQVIFDRGVGNRVLGTSDVVRKFGGSYSKRHDDEEQLVWNAFDTKQGDNSAPKLTPPYTDASAAVTLRSLHPPTGETLKFVIVAVDGLWDRLTSEEAVLLTVGYLNNPAFGEMPKPVLPLIHKLERPDEGSRKYPQEAWPDERERCGDGKEWVFARDKNAATHLTRNALGGADELFRRQVLSLRGKGARQMRDDTTAIVVFFDD
ncbi:hypothetical protein IAT38_001097 [Cryptococcus sp. DSM 104549]